MSQKRRRITAKRKQEIVLRMLRGEALDILSREFDIPAEKLTRWREAFIKGGMENLKTKPGMVDPKNWNTLYCIFHHMKKQIRIVSSKRLPSLVSCLQWPKPERIV